MQIYKLFRRKFTGLLVLFFVITLAVPGCSNAPQAKDNPVNLTVSAAVSLSDALNDLNGRFEAKDPGIHVQFNYGASGVLQKQIEQGSPVDIFVSAGESQMDSLKAKGLMVDNSIASVAKNTLVLVIPAKENKITSFEQLSEPTVKKIAMGNPKTVPAGQYGKEVLENLKLYDSVEKKIVFAEDVRQALTLVTTGNADAGLVYRTDAEVNSAVKVVAEAPEQSHAPIIYPIGIVKASHHQEAAKRWEDFVLSAEGQQILAKYGFYKNNQLNN